MKNNLLLALFLLAFSLSACGSEDGGPSDHPPPVAGVYNCTAGCDGACQFQSVIIDQKGTAIVATYPQLTCTGSIDNGGNYSSLCFGASAPNAKCAGTFLEKILTLDCSIGSTNCQRVMYHKN